MRKKQNKAHDILASSLLSYSASMWRCSALENAHGCLGYSQSLTSLLLTELENYHRCRAVQAHLGFRTKGLNEQGRLCNSFSRWLL